jgi:DNA-binding response OmpR family regulator
MFDYPIMVRYLLFQSRSKRNIFAVDQMPKETILILDKELHTQWTLKTVLESEKYIVLAVDRIERAIQSFREFEVSGLISEYRIDHFETPEMIRELKKNFPELYVMMLTDENFEEKEYRKIIRSGIDDLFFKPISVERILVHLKKGLRYRRMLIQKKRLEQRLNELRTNRKGGEVGLGNGSQVPHRLSTLT